MKPRRQTQHLRCQWCGVEFVGVVDYSPIAETSGTVCPHCDTAQQPRRP
jgi:hypothetical protein